MLLSYLVTSSMLKVICYHPPNWTLYEVWPEPCRHASFVSIQCLLFLHPQLCSFYFLFATWLIGLPFHQDSGQMLLLQDTSLGPSDQRHSVLPKDALCALSVHLLLSPGTIQHHGHQSRAKPKGEAGAPRGSKRAWPLPGGDSSGWRHHVNLERTSHSAPTAETQCHRTLEA